MSAHHLSAAVLVYAARYALGRRSAAPHDVAEAIAANLKAFKYDAGSRGALIADIERYDADGALGDPMDRQAWMRTLGLLKAAGA